MPSATQENRMLAPADTQHPHPHPHPLAHYPSTLIDVRIEPDGTRLMLRPVLPQDEGLIADLLARVSAAGRRNRFHGTVNLSRAELHRMSCIDYEHEMAFVVCACKNGVEIVIAEARFCIDADQQGAEFAVMVDDHWQRRGLGRWVMLALRDAAQAAGLTWLHGEVLRDNLPMLALMRDCGLCCTPDAEDDCLVHAQLRMGGNGDAAAHHVAQTQPHSALRWACSAVVRELAALRRRAAWHPTAMRLPTSEPASSSAAASGSAAQCGNTAQCGSAS
jgi:GNAT superfamily N-acetyltransferase